MSPKLIGTIARYHRRSSREAAAVLAELIALGAQLLDTLDGRLRRDKSNANDLPGKLMQTFDPWRLL